MAGFFRSAARGNGSRTRRPAPIRECVRALWREPFSQKIKGGAPPGLYSPHHVRWRAVGQLLVNADAMRSSVICPWAHITNIVRQAMGRITGESCNSATPHAFGDPCLGSERPPHRSRRQTIAGTRAMVRSLSFALPSRAKPASPALRFEGQVKRTRSAAGACGFHRCRNRTARLPARNAGVEHRARREPRGPVSAAVPRVQPHPQRAVFQSSACATRGSSGGWSSRPTLSCARCTAYSAATIFTACTPFALR